VLVVLDRLTGLAGLVRALLLLLVELVLRLFELLLGRSGEATGVPEGPRGPL
jgi:hypothetical protein